MSSQVIVGKRWPPPRWFAAQSDIPYPANLPQNNLQAAWRGDKNITLSGTFKKNGIGGTVTATGTLVYASAPPAIYIQVKEGGVLGVMKFFVSLNSGVDFTSILPVTSPVSGDYNIPGTAIDLHFTAATYQVANEFFSEVATWTDSIAAYDIVFPVGQRPILNKNAMGNYSLLFNSSIGVMSSSSLATLMAGGVKTPSELFLVVRYERDVTAAATETLICFENTTTQPFYRFYRDGANGQLRSSRRGDSGGVVLPTSSGALSGRLNQKIRGSFPGSNLTAEVNSVIVMNNVGMSITPALTLNELAIGASKIAGVAATNFTPNTSIGEIDMYSGAPDSARDAAINTYQSVYWAEPQAQVLAAAKYFSTATPTPTGNVPNDYIDTDIYSGVIVDVDVGTTLLQVKLISKPPPVGSFERYTVGVFLDDVYSSLLQIPDAPFFTETIVSLTLDGSAHKIRIDGRAIVQNVVGGTVRTMPTTSVYLIVQSDSIGVGTGTTNPYKFGWGLVSRYNYLTQDTYNLDFIGRPSRTLADIAATAPLITNQVAIVGNRLNPSNQTAYYLALGVNDYLAGASKATVKTQATNLFTSLRAAYPTLKLIIQGPVGKSSEVANAGGATLKDIADGLEEATALFSDSLFIAGGAGGVGVLVYTSANYDSDGLHPNDAGNAIMAAGFSPLVSAFVP